MKRKIIMSLVILMMFSVCGFLYACSERGSQPGTVEEGLIESSFYSETESVSLISNNDVNQITCYVYVCGCVNNPGVYGMSEESRIFEAIEMAGGLAQGAYEEALNLAQRVQDGQKIYVPTYEEIESGNFSADTAEKEKGLININTADVTALMTLPGVGESRAKAIIDYREKNGAYGNIEDIMKVSGIKESAYNKIKDYICVN